MHDLSDGKDTALISRAAGPVAAGVAGQGDDANAAEQQIGDGHNQEQAVQPLWPGHAGISKAPAIGFVLVITEEFFNGHPLAVEPADDRRSAIQVGHEEPGFIPFLGQIRHPSDNDVLSHAVMGAISYASEQFADALVDRMIQQLAIEAGGVDDHIGLDADDIMKVMVLAETGQFGAAKAPIGQENHFNGLGNHAAKHQEKGFFKAVAGAMAIIDMLLAAGPADGNGSALEDHRRPLRFESL